MHSAILSVVIPVYNEEGCLAELHRQLTVALSDCEQLSGYEIVFVDDGSQDGSLEVLRRLHRSDAEHVRVVVFSRNFGHEMASTAGLRYAGGDAVVLMDADLQDPPRLLPELVAKWREGYEIVYARRATRAGEPRLKKLTSFLFYRLLRALAGIDLPSDTGDFRLMDRKVVDAFNRCPERNRYVRGLTWWTGFSKTGVPFHRDPRLAGQTKYNYFKLFRLAMDSIVAFSTVPLRIATVVGAVSSVGTFLYMVAVIVEKFRGASPQPGYTLLAAGMLLIGSLVIMQLGIIGEYVGRIYQEVQARPPFVVREALGYDETAARDGHGHALPSELLPAARPHAD